MNKYIVFGAGAYADRALRLIGKENIEFILDNNPEKAGTYLNDIPIYLYEEKKGICAQYEIVIAVSDKYYKQIAEQLDKDGICNYVSVSKIQMESTKGKIASRYDYLGIYKKAVKWIRDNSVDGHAIICNSGKKKGYPEVTGYYIPTLIRWGYRELAVNYASWLLEIQKEDGSWYDTDDSAPYIFDTAQILKGLIAVRTIYHDLGKLDSAIIKGVDWVFSCMTASGQLVTPDKECWGENENVCSELIHLYCLSPLIDAGKIYNRVDYIEKADKILAYYKENHRDKIVNFSLLSHFYAYVVEAMVDLGEIDLAKEAMSNISSFQKESGAVPAYNNVDWVCSTGLFQLALIWFRLGEIDKGNAAFDYACKLQNETGGWYGSYISEENAEEENTYFPTEEISWANKYFLDALYYKNQAEFEEVSECFLENISKEDERYVTIRNVIANYSNAKILDVGCGKGRYLKNLLEDEPNNEYYGIDISRSVMKDLDCSPLICKTGVMTNIPFSDDMFTVVYTCEALEHAIDIRNAIREMARVTKKNGYIVVIDKNEGCYGTLEIGDWEQWPNEDELREIMMDYCSVVTVKHGLKYEGMSNPDLFTAWIGCVG